MSRRHSSKCKHRVLARRRVRRQEKLSALTADRMMGKSHHKLHHRGALRPPTIAEMMDA